MFIIGRISINELTGDNAGGANLDEKTCAHIGLLAYKYECAGIENWAQNALLQKLGGDDRDISGSLDLAYLLQVSTNCNWPTSLTELVEKHLLNTVAAGPLQLKTVLETAESVGSNQLAARAYYHFLRSQKWSLSLRGRRDRNLGHASSLTLVSAPLEVWGDSGLDVLTDTQRLSLYRGFISLSALRGRLRTMPEVDRCKASPFCVCLEPHKKAWSDHAQEIWMEDSFNDVTEFLVEMKQRMGIDSWTSKSHTAGLCARVELRNEIDSFLDQFEASLTKFFPVHM